MREFDFIHWIRSVTRLDSAVVPVGPGDDCAVVWCGGERLLITVDQVLDGVHVRLAEHGAAAVGRKAMARNLSDVAAMAAWPMCAVASVALPRGFAREDAEKLYMGIRDAGLAFGCPVVGGDVSTWDKPLAVSVTVLARPAGVEPILRRGARPGDAVCVTGWLGGAWRGRRHLEFTPRIHEARLLASRYDIHAMMDLSDGLSGDVKHLCEASGVGVEIFAAAVPVHADLKNGTMDPPTADPLTAALCDGEDYELLFALSEAHAAALLAEQPLGVPVSRVGTITADKTITLILPDGIRRPMPAAGWEHTT
ncbi:MAG: thiamine-phosphate kinase [Phycisphaerae bacterium]|nr:thiamine-phosphate kinase [Phycisphaerae bacterium]